MLAKKGFGGVGCTNPLGCTGAMSGVAVFLGKVNPKFGVGFLGESGGGLGWGIEQVSNWRD